MSRPSDCVLAIDQSTSATKAILFDDLGRPVDNASSPHRQHYPAEGRVEHDAEEIWSNLLRVCRELMARHRGVLPRCVSVTNQRETFVVFDRVTGRPLHRAIVWLCRSGEAVCQELLAAGHDPLVRRKTGLRIDTYFTAPKVMGLLRSDASIRAAVADGAAVVATMDAYLVHRLTEGRVLATDSTNASRTLLLDIATRRWDEQLCRLFDVPTHALPEVREATAHFGDTTLGGVLPRAVPIVGVIGDSQASLFAQRGFGPGAAKVTFGTGSSLLLNTGPAPRDPGASGAVATIAWSHAGDATYSFEGLINYSAATVAWLVDQLGLIGSAADAEPLATSVSDNGGVYLVPAFNGLGAPHWSPRARAAIVGLTSFATRAHLARAALESIGYQVRDALDAMRRSAGIGVTRVFADGGPTRNRFLMQFVADVADVELVVADVPDCSALGAAMAGLLGSGRYANLRELESLPRETTVYRRQRSEADVASLRAGWDRAVRQVLAGVD